MPFKPVGISLSYFPSRGATLTTPVRPEDSGNFPSPCANYAPIYPGFTHTQNPILYPSLPPFYSLIKARASRAISRQYCVRPIPAPTACIQSVSSPSFLNEKWRKGGPGSVGAAVSAPSGGVRVQPCGPRDPSPPKHDIRYY